MTLLAEDWRSRARQLAQGLVAAGKLWSPQWQEAICAVPRHELVPDILRRDPDGSWHRLDTTTTQGQRDWLEQAYSNKALLTAAAEGAGPRELRSSSSMPGLMTRMLEALDVRDGHRVLEIGTGTGYNAAHPAGQARERPRPRRQADAQPDQRVTTLDPRTPWNCLVVWFLASFTLGADIAVGYGRPDHKRNPTVTSIATGDGSWAEVTITGDDGVHQLRAGGPRRVWRIIGDAHALWTTLRRPSWDRLGLTVTPRHQQVWLDSPISAHIWPLPAPTPGP